MRKWQDLVPGCFGVEDHIFALHRADEDRAKEAIEKAKAAGAKKDDFEKELVWHVYKKVRDCQILCKRLKDQSKKLDELW
jgi:hypothetical protein